MDANENKGTQDTLPVVDESSVPAPKPSGEEEKRFTQQEVDALVASRHSTLDKEIDKLTKQLGKTTVATTELQALRTTIKKLQEEKDELELSTANDNPDLQAIIKKRRELNEREQTLSDRETDIDARIAEFEADIEHANEIGKKEVASELAVEFKVDAETILQFPSDTPEQMRDIAKKLANIAKGTGTPALVGTGVKPESGLGGGAGGVSEEDHLKRRYPSMFPK
jgi:chromosome segregation ATPase